MDSEELKAELRRSDYVASKFSDSLMATPVEEWESVRVEFAEKYADVLEYRQRCRDEINKGAE